MNNSVVNPGERIRLQLQGDELVLMALTDGETEPGVAGSLRKLRQVLGQEMLTAATLERAMTEVEDLLMPLLQTLPPRTELEVHGAELAEVFHLLAACDGSVVSLEAVEDLFHQLAAHTSGSPVAWRHAASPDTVALGLVMLRETMHHGGFRSVFWLLQVE